MPKRFYFTNSPPGSPTPALATSSTLWDVTAARVVVLLGETKSGANAAVPAVSESSTSNIWDVQLVGAYSTPILQDVTFQGQVTFCVARLESNAAADFVPRYIIWVLAPDNTVRGVIHNGFQTSLTEEFPTTLTGRSMFFNMTDTVNALVGDRLVVDFGYRATNAVATSYNGTIRIGGTNATDLVNGDNATNSAIRSGWVEFADDSFTTAFTEPPPDPGDVEDGDIALRGAVRTFGSVANGSQTSDAGTAIDDYILVVADLDYKTGITIANATGVVDLAGAAGWTQIAAANGTNMLTRAWIGKATTAGAKTVALTQAPTPADSALHYHIYTLDPSGGTIAIDGTPTTQTADLTSPYTHSAITVAGTKDMLVCIHGQVQFSATSAYSAQPDGMIDTESYANPDVGFQSCYEMLSAAGSTGTRNQVGTAATGGGASGLMFALRNTIAVPDSGIPPGRMMIGY
jgi:hypothetical protein